MFMGFIAKYLSMMCFLTCFKLVFCSVIYNVFKLCNNLQMSVLKYTFGAD